MTTKKRPRAARRNPWIRASPTIAALVEALSAAHFTHATLLAIARTLKVRGVCQTCGCTDQAACEGGCVWTDATHTLCSNCTELAAHVRGIHQARARAIASVADKR